MHREEIERWQHRHVFNVEKKSIERRTLIVVIITLITMAAEIIFGWLTHSMALFADGWHMGTHAFALGISLLVYIMARKLAEDGSFAFGAWKIEVLGAYSSAIVLGLVGLIMILTSVERILHPLAIQYDQALFIAAIGLTVNALCAVILNTGLDSMRGAGREPPEHRHAGPGHPDHCHQDLNHRSAYLHVMADALTSVLAIGALLGAKYFSLDWLDPFMGIVGAALILRWSFCLVRDSAKILLEREMDSPIIDEIREELEADGDTRICDLHLWQVAQNRYACIVSLVTGDKHTIEEYKMRLGKVHELAHVTVEIYHCEEKAA